jgi:para-nitrobenzyl esterase
LGVVLAATGATACAGCADDGESTTATPSGVGTTVEVEQGEVTGSALGALRIFLGIPYAAPPVGELRLRPPAAPLPFDGAFDAGNYGSVCPQLYYPSGMIGAPSTQVVGEEDCLTLNVWAHADGEPRPVMVFLHGGGFVAGSSSQPIYESSVLATTGDVVVVTLNYRLGALGFLATEALATESGEDSAGNYGLRDQLAALEWLQRNVAAFGGDPANVTVFGESAGGYSICALLGAPETEGLFARAIIESGGGCYGFPGLRTASLTAPSGVDKGDEVLAEVGCADAPDELACLRALPVETLAPAGQGGDAWMKGMVFWPLVDGALVQDDALDLFQDGARDEPLVIGSNADEMSAFTASIPIPSEAAYQQLVAQLIPVPTISSEVLALYPASAFASPHAAYDALLSDIAFVCPALAMAHAAAGGAAPAWAYHFTRTAGGWAASLGAFHSYELAFVFGGFLGFGLTPTPEDLGLAAGLQQAWSSFARGGAPLTSPAWPAYEAATPSIQLLDVPLSSASEIRDGRCAGLASLGLVRE